MRLPCIVKNKTLYWIWADKIMPVRFKGINGGCIDKENKYQVTCKMSTKKDRTFKHRKREFTYSMGDIRYFYAGDIGKTVFLTKSDAENSLKEMGK